MDHNYNNEQNRFGQVARLWDKIYPRGSKEWNDLLDEFVQRRVFLDPTMTIYLAGRDLPPSPAVAMTAGTVAGDAEPRLWIATANAGITCPPVPPPAIKKRPDATGRGPGIGGAGRGLGVGEAVRSLISALNRRAH